MCALAAFYQGRLSNGRNEIKPLRDDDGWDIESRWTKHDDGPAHAHYIVRFDPGTAPQQLRLATGWASSS